MGNPNSADRRARWELLILLGMYLGYMAFILSRTAIQAAAGELLADQSVGLNKSSFGEILAWGTAGMVAGKLGTGAIADALGGRRVFLLALGTAALAAVAMGFARSYPAFAAANFLMLFSAAAGWPAMASLVAAWYPPEKYGRVWGIISTSSRLSSVLSMFFLGLLLARVPWPGLFFTAGALSLAVVALIFFLLKAHPREVGLSPPAAEAARETAPRPPVRSALAGFFRNRRFYLICTSLMATTVMMEFIGFLPLFLQESFGLAPSSAATASSAFPAGCLVALVGGGFLYDKVSRFGRISLLGALLSFGSACLASLWILPAAGLPPAATQVTATLILFFFGLSVAPAYYLPMSIFSVEFGGVHCGLLIGLIDATGYAASMIYQAAGGHLVERSGWPSMLVLLIVCSAVAVVATLWFAWEDYRANAPAR